MSKQLNLKTGGNVRIVRTFVVITDGEHWGHTSSSVPLTDFVRTTDMSEEVNEND